MNKIITAPILLIGFNRPDVIKQAFDYIRKAKPQKLFVTIDGPRKHIQNEQKMIEEVKKIVKCVDWDCETHYKFNNENVGAEITVSAGVSWVLENEETVIVIEDDIIAPLSFLKFAQDMLQKYINQDNVYMISSCQTTPMELPNDEDYLFGLYGHIWGWATWKRAWSKFDLNIDDFDEVLKGDAINRLVQSKSEKKRWLSTINQMKRKGMGNNTWDVCWSYIRLKENGLSIIPKVHLSSNIGIEGLHSSGKTVSHFRAFDDDFKVTQHPIEVIRNKEYDNYHFKNHINRKPSLIKRAYGKAKRIFKLK